MNLKWTKYCILPVAGADNVDSRVNDNVNGNNTIFTNLYIISVTLSATDNPKLSKRLIKGFGRSVYWNEHKIKCGNESRTN